MKKKYFIYGSLAFLQFISTATAQDKSSEINKTQIDLVYNQYLQEGNHSAVTGGIGDEKLTVCGPSLSIKKDYGNRQLKINSGADIISSVSTDRIDYVVSSASVLDARAYSNITYQYRNTNNQTDLYGGLGFSLESDYLSIGSKVGITKEQPEKLSQFSVEFQMFNDDLRWGRVSVGKWKPETLVYPVELRYKEWHKEYRRNSYNLKLGYSKALNKRTIFGVFPLVTLQKGLLATPFHRVYFSDGTKAVENLPTERAKFSTGLKWNQFIGGRVITKNTINPYIDTWGINSISVENETAIKISSIWTILPNIRYYSQKGSRYFAAYKDHSSNVNYYSSDYDLSNFHTINLGMGIKFLPYSKYGKRSQFNALIFRYSYMKRSDGLRAHVLSLNIQIEKNKTKKDKK
jgi:hypothetical protein